MKRIIYISLGCVGLALGVIGALVPLLPTVPFLLLAAFGFAKSSPRLHDWFRETKLYKNNLDSFLRGNGMTVKNKLLIMAVVTATMTLGFLLMSQVLIGRIILACVWVMHIVLFVFVIKTKNKACKKRKDQVCTANDVQRFS